MSSDEQLAARGTRGDAAAFEAIFRRYHQDLYRFCLAMVGNAHDAQDTLQNTMVKVLRALPGEEREIRLRPWLYRIARNESIETLRRRRDESELEPHQATVAGPTETAETRARLRQLMADLECLPERQRAVLIMRELSGLGYAEIATALESSEGVARQTLYEARLSLRQLEAGREMTCEQITKELSDADGRVTRRREVQAHLRSCADCRAFQREIERRHRDLAALSPLPAAASTGLLHSLLTEGAGAATAAAGGGTAGALAAGGGTTIAGSAAIKAVATVAVVATIGVGAERSGVVDLDRGGSSSAAPAREAAPAAGDPGDPAATAAGRDRTANPPPGAEGGDAMGVSANPPAATARKGETGADAGASPPGGGYGRAAAEHGGRPESPPTAATRGQETASSKKPADAGKPDFAGPPQAGSAAPPAATPPIPPAAKPASPPGPALMDPGGKPDAAPSAPPAGPGGTKSP